MSDTAFENLSRIVVCAFLCAAAALGVAAFLGVFVGVLVNAFAFGWGCVR